MHKNKALVSLVFGLGIILIGGFGLLIFGLYQRASDPDFKFFSENSDKPAQISSAANPTPRLNTNLPVNISIPLPTGERIKEIEASGNRIIVHITNQAKQDQIMVLDAETGAVIRRLRFDPQP